MAYEKQNFEKGQILRADHLNHMEDGIESNSLPIVLDTSLKISGAAADSKAVGDIIIQEHNRAVSKETEINNSVVAQNSVIGELQQEIKKTTPTTTVTDSAPWSSKHIVDVLCPPLEEAGNPVQCYPVSGYPLVVKATWEPVQEGSGTPYPAGGGPNLLDISQCTALVFKPLGLTITIDGDVFKVSGVPSSEVTVEGQYSFAVASCAQTELRGKGYKITPFALKGNVSSAWGLRTEDEDSLAIAAKLTPGVNADIQLRLMVSKDTPAAYAPYENIRPIKGRDSVTVERCGENLYNVNHFVGSYWVDDNYHKSNDFVNIHSSFWASYKIPCNVGDTINVSGFPELGGVSCVWTSDVSGEKYFKDAGSSLKVNASYAVPSGAQCLVLGVAGKLSVPDANYDNAMISIGVSPTTYTPYIGQTSTLTLPRTIYGGTVDGVTGEGQETWKFLTLDGTESWEYEGNIYFVAYGILSNLPLETSGKCSHFIYRYYYGGDNIFCVSNSIKVGAVLTAKYANADEWKSYLAAQYAAGTPVQIAYKLATPTPFTATGAQPIPALSGVNTVLTDADSATVTGRADPIKRITDLEDAVASMTNT